MTQSTVTIESLKDLSNDLKNKLDIVEANNKGLYMQIEIQVLVISRLEKQRDELLEALELAAISGLHYMSIETKDKIYAAIAKAKGE